MASDRIVGAISLCFLVSCGVVSESTKSLSSGTSPTSGLPTSSGTSGQILSTNGAGSVSWVSPRRVCVMVIGSDNGTTLVNADIAPQGRQCFVPNNATVIEVTVAADAGTPSVAVAKNHAGAVTDLLSGALSTAAAGGIACSNSAGSTGIDGITTCSATLTTTTLLAGDYIETHTATAGGTAKRMSISVTYTVP